jgi:hypothetical protein
VNQTEFSSTVLGRILFVYSKDGKIRCLSAGEERSYDMTGWVHTATIDPAKWIVHLCVGANTQRV